jgi:hypothetical protein
LHAGNREEGLIDRCDLFFLAKAKDGDYHQEMNGPTFLNWFENQLMPALKSRSEQGFLELRDRVGWQFDQF